MSNLRTLASGLCIVALVVVTGPATGSAQSETSPALAAEEDDRGSADSAETSAEENDRGAADDAPSEGGGIVIEAVGRPRDVIQLPGLSEGEEDTSGEGDESSPGAVVIQRGEAGAAGSGTSGAIRLTYEQNGSSVLVPARVGRHDVYFVLDTGASYTTLTSEIARLARITPDDRAPTAMMQTAGGVRSAQFGLMETLSLGDTTLRNVTFTLCDACGFGTYRARPVVGLLGLNVLQRFRMNMDASQGVVELVPHGDFRDQSADLRPWLGFHLMTHPSRVPLNSQGRSVVQIRNIAEVEAQGVVAEFRCQLLDGSIAMVRTHPARVARNSRADTEFRQSVSACQNWQAELVEGRWR